MDMLEDQVEKQESAWKDLVWLPLSRTCRARKTEGNSSPNMRGDTWAECIMSSYELTSPTCYEKGLLWC